MFSDFQSAFGWDTLSQVHPSILVEDSVDADAHFVISHFMSLAIKQNKPVCLVSFSKTLDHYSTILRKFGINLETAATSGNFVYIDAGEMLNTENTNIETLRDIFLNIATRLSHALDVCLVIEDITPLFSFSYPLSSVLVFLQYCQQLAKKKNGLFLTRIHGDLESAQELASLLVHRVDYVVVVEGLPTGISQEVHGQITIGRGATLETSSFVPCLLQYKTYDGSIKFFAKGLSNALL